MAATTTRSQQAAGAAGPEVLTPGYTHAFQIAALILAVAVPIARGCFALHPTVLERDLAGPGPSGPLTPGQQRRQRRY